jgi:hypothetical protein
MEGWREAPGWFVIPATFSFVIPAQAGIGSILSSRGLTAGSR